MKYLDAYYAPSYAVARKAALREALDDLTVRVRRWPEKRYLETIRRNLALGKLDLVVRAYDRLTGDQIDYLGGAADSYITDYLLAPLGQPS